MAKRAERLPIAPQARRGAGASIAGEKVLSQARKYVQKPSVSEQTNGKTALVRFLLKTNAYCVVQRAFRRLERSVETRPTSIGLFPALHGDSIAVQAQDRRFVGITRGSSRHNIQRYDFQGRCYCTINVPLRGLHGTT